MSTEKMRKADGMQNTCILLNEVMAAAKNTTYK